MSSHSKKNLNCPRPKRGSTTPKESGTTPAQSCSVLKSELSHHSAESLHSPAPSRHSQSTETPEFQALNDEAFDAVIDFLSGKEIPLAETGEFFRGKPKLRLGIPLGQVLHILNPQKKKKNTPTSAPPAAVKLSTPVTSSDSESRGSTVSTVPSSTMLNQGTAENDGSEPSSAASASGKQSAVSAIQGKPAPETRKKEVNDYVVVMDHLRKVLPQLAFELYGGETANRHFRVYQEESLVDSEEGFLRYQVAVLIAHKAMEKLLTEQFKEALQQSGHQLEHQDLDMELDFFADAFLHNTDGTINGAPSPTHGKINSPNGGSPPRDRERHLGRVTAIFELTLHPAVIRYKLLQLEKRIAFYRVYTAAMGFLNQGEDVSWSMVNESRPLAGQQLIMCGVVVPRWRISEAHEFLTDANCFSNLHRFGWEVLPSMMADLERGQSGTLFVFRLYNKPPSDGRSHFTMPAWDFDKVVRVAVPKLHDRYSLQVAIAGTFSLGCSVADIDIFDWELKDVGEFIGTNTSLDPYYFFAPQCWVQEEKWTRPKPLPGPLPEDVEDLKEKIKLSFALPYGIECMSVNLESLADDNELREDKPSSAFANTPENPFVFSELKCWVRRQGDATPTATPERPGH